jgi:hypothetical protein
MMGSSRRWVAHALLVVTAVGIGAYMATLSAIAPIVSDDLHYCFGMDRGGLHDLSDVLRSAVDLYNRYGLRLGTALYFLVFLFGRWLFIVLNPLAFLALGYVVFVIALGRRLDRGSIRDVSMLLFIYLLIGGAGPGITEVSFWATGATQYMWGAGIALGFLVPFRFVLEGRIVIRDTRENAVLMYVIGGLVGLVQETIVPSVIGLLAILWLVCARRGTRLPAWFYTGMAGVVAGFLVFMVAPGNYRRAANAGEHLWNLTLVERLVDVAPYLFKKFVVYSGRMLVTILEVLVAIGLVALAIVPGRSIADRLRIFASRPMVLGGVFLTTAAVTIFSLFVSPIRMSSRVYFGAGLMIVLFLVIWVWLLFYERFPVLGKYVVGTICFLCFMEMAAIANEYVDIHRQLRQRLQIVEQAKRNGEFTVRLPIYQRHRKRRIWVPDITEDPTHNRNRNFAFYYGLDEVVGYNAETSRHPPKF